MKGPLLQVAAGAKVHLHPEAVVEAKELRLRAVAVAVKELRLQVVVVAKAPRLRVEAAATAEKSPRRTEGRRYDHTGPPHLTCDQGAAGPEPFHVGF